MRTLRALIGSLCAVLQLGAPAGPATAQPDPETMRMYALGLLRKGPAWSVTADSAREGLGLRMLEEGGAVGVGPVLGGRDFLGVFIFASDSPAAVARTAGRDAALRDSVFLLEIHPWYAARGIGEGLAAARAVKQDSVPPPITYQFGLLRRGKAWTPARTPALEQLQADHLANINRLAAEGSLVMAGPLGGDGVLRGVFVFQVGSLEEAERLAATDPAVKAGRLIVDLYEWRTPAGVVPPLKN